MNLEWKNTIVNFNYFLFEKLTNSLFFLFSGINILIKQLLVILERPPAQNSPRNILNSLNNDCIDEIYRKLSNVEDVLSAGIVCQKFQESAIRCLKSKFNYLEIDEKNLDILKKEQYWKLYAPLVSEISFTSTLDAELDRYVFNSIAKFCGDSLKSFRLNDCRSDFEKLQFLGLECLSIASKDLERFNNDISELWYLQNMPKLKSASFYYCEELTDYALFEFLKLNQQLEYFILQSEYVSTFIFKYIAKYSPNLVSLVFENYYNEITKSEIHENIKHCLQLKKLKRFDLFGINISLETVINMFAKSDVPIEILSINLFKRSHPCKNLLTLKTLKHLVIETNSCRSLHKLIANVVRTQTALKTMYVLQGSHGKWVRNIKLFSMMGYNTMLEITLLENINLFCNDFGIEIFIFHDGRIDFTKNIFNVNGNWLKNSQISDGYVVIISLK